MNRATMIWTILMIAGGGFLVVRAAQTGMGSVYVQPVEQTATDDETVITTYETVDPKLRDEAGVTFSWARTLGVWCAALLTLCIFSFLYGDNAFYKVAESIFVGVSAAYAMVVAFWNELVVAGFRDGKP